MNEFKVIQDKVEGIEIQGVIGDSVMKIVKEKERMLLEKCPSIKDIEIASYNFTYKTGKYPSEIRMPVKLYEELVVAASFGMYGNIMPITIMGMNILIDDNLESFEIIGYEDFMGMKKVIK